ncbi:MAG: hypothetical protein FWE09_04775 [Treponema sp.]|nr:hypothetical protein [Treponema sp.]
MRHASSGFFASCALFFCIAFAGCEFFQWPQPETPPSPPAWFTYLDPAGRPVADATERLAVFFGLNPLYQTEAASRIAIMADPLSVSGDSAVRSVNTSKIETSGEIGMLFLGESDFPSEITIAHEGEALFGSFVNRHGDLYSVVFSDSAGEREARFEGLALDAGLLESLLSVDKKLSLDESARLRRIIAFFAVLESLRLQIDATRWAGWGWEIFSAAVNDGDLVSASGMIITSHTNGTGARANPALARRLALAGLKVEPLARGSAAWMLPPAPPPIPPENHGALPQVHVKIDGVPALNNAQKPIYLDLEAAVSIEISSSDEGAIDLEYLFFAFDPRRGLIMHRSTAPSNSAFFSFEEESLEEDIVRLEVRRNRIGHFYEGAVSLVIRFAQQVEINGEPTGYAWSARPGRYWGGEILEAKGAGYLFVLNFTVIKPREEA